MEDFFSSYHPESELGNEWRARWFACSDMWQRTSPTHHGGGWGWWHLPWTRSNRAGSSLWRKKKQGAGSLKGSKRGWRGFGEKLEVAWKISGVRAGRAGEGGSLQIFGRNEHFRYFFLYFFLCTSYSFFPIIIGFYHLFMLPEHR